MPRPRDAQRSTALAARTANQLNQQRWPPPQSSSNISISTSADGRCTSLQIGRPPSSDSAVPQVYTSPDGRATVVNIVRPRSPSPSLEMVTETLSKSGRMVIRHMTRDFGYNSHQIADELIFPHHLIEYVVEQQKLEIQPSPEELLLARDARALSSEGRKMINESCAEGYGLQAIARIGDYPLETVERVLVESTGADPPPPAPEVAEQASSLSHDERHRIEVLYLDAGFGPLKISSITGLSAKVVRLVEDDIIKARRPPPSAPTHDHAIETAAATRNDTETHRQAATSASTALGRAEGSSRTRESASTAGQTRAEPSGRSRVTKPRSERRRRHVWVHESQVCFSRAHGANQSGTATPENCRICRGDFDHLVGREPPTRTSRTRTGEQ